MNVIAENVARIREEMARAEARAGRPEGSVKLLAATKTNGPEAILEAIAAGVDLCGENRVQEYISKSEVNAYGSCPVQFIGPLQKNKVKYLVGQVALIHSVDSLALMEAISDLASALPQHTVVPYPNIPKRQYPLNTDRTDCG